MLLYDSILSFQRPPGLENNKMATGNIEIELQNVLEVSRAKPVLPFEQKEIFLPKVKMKNLRKTRVNAFLGL